MATLDDFLPEPRLCEVDAVHVALAPAEAFARVRQLDLAESPIVAALFALRALPERLSGRTVATASVKLADIGRGDAPGFLVLAEGGERLCVGAIGRFWQPEISWASVTPAGFAAFDQEGYGKVAWELRCEPEAGGSRVVMEVRVTATDDASWKKQQRYFALIGPFSRFIRHSTLRRFARAVNEGAAAHEGDAHAASLEALPMPGDAAIPEAKAQVTHAIEIEAPPRAVWPWLVQMGCGRAGFYSYDDLDNAGVRSATELLPELQKLAVGDRIEATPDGRGHFTVLGLEPERALVLGGLYDLEHGQELAMDAKKPERYWQASWAFLLEPLPGERTRLCTRARADYAPGGASGLLRLAAERVVHGFMQRAQLRHLKERVEGHAPRVHDTWHDVAQGVAGAAGILVDLVTPFRRGARSHWGLSDEDAAKRCAGDALVPEPSWQWTHAIEIGAPPDAVWPWVAQLGQDKAGFYSYQFLENLTGCEVQNAARVHPEWQDVKPGDALRLHPSMPPLRIAAVERGRALVAHVDSRADEKGAERWVAISWAFVLEPRPEGRTRLISRFRSACSDDLVSRLAYGPYLTEAVGFVMDRQLLRGLRARVEETEARAARTGRS